MHTWYIVGDSHVGAMNYAINNGWLKSHAVSHIVHGATAVGLRNPNSATNAIAIFKKLLLPPREKTIPVIHLGEVDCGFVIWWRAIKYNESVETQLNASVDAYFEFVDCLLGSGYPNVVITGATLPTILDGQDWGCVANKRREINVSLSDRTLLTLKYNELLKNNASIRRLPFVEITQYIMDSQAGILAEEFRNPDPRDHHIDPAKGAKLWAEVLNRIDEASLGVS